jgi:hypothetical protein
VGKPKLGKPMSLWEDNIKIGLKAIGWMWILVIWLRIERSGRLL